MPTKQPYSYSEFERYLQKQMSPLEMHAFEKSMMSDPFLADALEGYQASNTSLVKQHLAQINVTIKSQDRQDTKVVFISSAKWLRVAAIFVVIIGAGIITYRILNKPSDNIEIAKVEHPTLAPADSIGPTSDAIAQQTPLGKTANDNTKTASPTIEQNMAKGNASAPMAMAQTGNDTGVAAMSDTSARLQNADEKFALSSARAGKDLSEVVASKSVSTPRDGWVKFQAYIDKEVSAAKEKNAALTGMKVELEFSVDRNGTIEDIKILNATNTEVAKIATDILRKSPRWTPLANNSKAKIVLNF